MSEPVDASVWLVTADCGDYYCEGTHVVAIAKSPDEAQALKALAEAARWTNDAGSSGKRWADVTVEQVTLGELREETS